MNDADVPSEPIKILELVASAIRGAMGEEIDAYPGHHDPDTADPMNRAFRAIVAAIVTHEDASNAVLHTKMSEWLRTLAEQRLQRDGFDTTKLKVLIESEPGSPDDWLAFLILSSKPQIEASIQGDEADSV